MLDLTAGEWHESIALEEIKDALSQQIGHDANVVPEVKAIPEVNAFVAVGFVVGSESRQYSQLNAGSVAIFLN